eukprot:PhM_4_TR7618/c0_g2_i1/m.4852/K19801/PI4KB; phosphatidylinositol 4-kinase B
MSSSASAEPTASCPPEDTTTATATATAASSLLSLPSLSLSSAATTNNVMANTTTGISSSSSSSYSSLELWQWIQTVLLSLRATATSAAASAATTAVGSDPWPEFRCESDAFRACDACLVFHQQLLFLAGVVGAKSTNNSTSSSTNNTTNPFSNLIVSISQISAHTALRFSLSATSMLHFYDAAAAALGASATPADSVPLQEVNATRATLRRLVDVISASHPSTVGDATFFDHHCCFLTSVVNVSKSLAAQSDRSRRVSDMRSILRSMNNFVLQELCYIPTGGNGDVLRRIVRFAVDDCAVFSTRERAPFLLVVEVQTNQKGVSCGQIAAAVRGMSRDEVDISSSDKGWTPTQPAAAVDRQEATTKSPIEHIYGDTWAETKAAIRKSSPVGHLPGWDADAYIVKQGDNLIQECLALQLVSTIDEIWRQSNLPLRLTSYSVVVTGPDSGLIECVTDAKTIDSIKKTMMTLTGATSSPRLVEYWQWAYGAITSESYRASQRHFIESCAAYSVVCYVLQLRDRHNGNILLSRDGRMIHIDFGFLLTTSPGGWNFENVPFKLPLEYVDVMGPDGFAYFKLLVFMGLSNLRTHVHRLMSLIELSDAKCIPCLSGNAAMTAQMVSERFMLTVSESEFMRHVKDIIDHSLDNWRTRGYDRFQRMQNGIEH